MRTARSLTVSYCFGAAQRSPAFPAIKDMQFDDWLRMVGLTVPFGIGIHWLTWQHVYDAKPRWAFRACAVALLAFWFCNAASTIEEAKRCPTVQRDCIPKK
jgi:hypothetical protein